MKLTRSDDGCAPYYPCEPICSISALALALGIPEQRLQRLAAVANRSYRLAKEEQKRDGSVRQTFDAYPRLKAVQTRIKEHILCRAEYPSYLNGSLKGRSTRRNAQAHVGAKITISEDIANFFPTISPTLVRTMWRGLFGFSDEVASLLAILTTKDQGVPQGAVTSSYLANLVFWALEPTLYRKFKRRGYVYTRYVDDITVSSIRWLTNEQKSEIISGIYGMLRSAGVKPKRKKHEVSTAKGRITTTKLVHNEQVSLTKEVRQGVRAAVHLVEQKAAFGERDSTLHKELASVSSRVGRLNSFHPTQGAALKTRLKQLRSALENAPQVLENEHRTNLPGTVSSAPPPWD